MTTIDARMVQRRDTAATWTQANPVLSVGEFGFETDTLQLKVGDGNTPWNTLNYLGLSEAQIQALVSDAVVPAIVNAAAQVQTVADAAAIAFDGVADSRIGTFVGQRHTPFSTPERLIWGRTANKKLTGPTNGQELVLHQTTGAGMGLRFWLAIAIGSGDQTSRLNYDGRVRVYVDGETTPSIDLDACVFLNYLNAQYMNPGSISTDLYWCKADGGGLTACHGGNRMLLPFSNGIKITLANTTNAGGSFIYSQFDVATVADNPTMQVPPYRLTAQGDSGRSLRAVNPDADATLHTLAGEGFVTGHFLAARTAPGGGRSYLERKIQIYPNGSTTPTITTSGTEDWFDSSFYYDNDTPFSRQGSMGFGVQAAGTNTLYATNQFVDLLAQGQAVEFTNGLVMKWVQAVDLTDYTAYASCVWWYRKILVPKNVHDTFDRPDSSTLGVADSGQTWVNGVGTWGISGNSAYNASNTNDALCLIETGDTDQDVTFVYGTTVGANSGCVFGAVDKDNLYIYNAVAHALAKKVNGTTSAVPNPGTGTTVNAGDTIRVTKTGSTITVYQNGTQLYQVTDTSVVGGSKAGLFAPTTGSRFASFDVVVE